MPPPGPAKQFDRQKALQKGLGLFWKRGYPDVSLNDLLAEMRIGRQSFYNTFGSKADLFDEAVQQYVGQYQQPMIKLLSAGDSPDANLMKFLSQWETAAGKKPNDGCFLVNTCDDLPCLRSESVDLVTAAAKQMEDAIAKQIERAKKTLEIASDLSARKIARILTMLGNGMMVDARNPNSTASSKGLLTATYRGLVTPIE
ncbi:MAG: TetR/AcrR family transcriptional regulator [Rubripirellula sp.]